MIARLKQIRGEAGISAAAVAKAVGVSLQTIFNWESGRAHPRRAHMNTVHDFLLAEGAITGDISTGMLFDLIPAPDTDSQQDDRTLEMFEDGEQAASPAGPNPARELPC